MSILDLVRQHQASRPHELNELNEERGVNSLTSFNSYTQEPPRPEPERCAEWLYRFIRGRYPKLADVKTAALTAGFSEEAIIIALSHSSLVVYKAFPRRNVGEVEHVRTVDDWPDDPPLKGTN